MAFFIYGIILSFVILAYIKAGVRFSLFNIYFGLFLLFYGPAFFIYNASEKLLETNYAITSANMLSCFVVGFFIGKFLFREVKGKKRVAYTTYSNWTDYLPEEKVKIKEGLLYALLLLSAAVIFAGLFLYGGISSLGTLMSNPLADAELIKQLRQDAGVTGWIAPFYVYTTSGIGRLLAFLFIGLALQKKNPIMVFAAFAFAVLLSISYLANMSKSSFVVFYCQLLFFMMLFFNVRINFKKSLLYVSLIIPLLIGVYLVATNAGDAGTALDLIGHRIFVEPIRVLQLYPKFYPDILPYTNGMNIRLVHDFFSSDNYVPAHVAVTGGLEHASFNAMFIADAYVDFSYFGVVIQSIFVGYLLSYLDFLLYRKNNYLQKALMAALLIGIFSMINSGLITSLIGFGLITLPILAYFLRDRRRRRIYIGPSDFEYTEQFKVI
jgi:oligosaccharide repeat unit polymerase